MAEVNLLKVTDLLIKGNQEKKKKKQQRADFFDEEEETYAYQEKPRQTALNEGPQVTTGKTFEGINSRKSVFDRTAVFHTGE